MAKDKAQKVIDYVKQKHANLGGRDVRFLPLAEIQPNSWNPNVMDPKMFEKEKASITEFGMVDPITVRRIGKLWEIIDGFHRYTACKELGHEEILVIDLGDIDDQKAKKLTIIANDLRGQSDPMRLVQLVDDLAKQETTDALSTLLPMSKLELDSLVASMKPYDIPPPLPTNDGQGGPGVDIESIITGQKDVKLALGGIKGSIPEALFKRLMVEYGNSMQAVGTKSMERIVEDLCDRLMTVQRPLREEKKEEEA